MGSPDYDPEDLTYYDDDDLQYVESEDDSDDNDYLDEESEEGWDRDGDDAEYIVVSTRNSSESTQYDNPKRVLAVAQPTYSSRNDPYFEAFKDGAKEALKEATREIVRLSTEKAALRARVAHQQELTRIAEESRRELQRREEIRLAEQLRRDEERANTLRMMDRLFSGLLEDLHQVRRMADEMEGFWIFRSHAHSSDELLRDPVFARIHSRFGAFEDVINRQRSYGTCDAVVETNYYSLKMQVEARVADVQAYILSRRATGWELVLDTLGRIFRRAVAYIASTSLLRISGF